MKLSSTVNPTSEVLYVSLKALLIQINTIQIFFVHEVSLFQNEGQQQQIVKETFQLVSKRDDNVCNFLEGGR